ncbi:Cob(I)yrinic acid a,c-diamide adenosyltransferase [Abditibacteriota bacterium]|nr:Cob(I)yrinic acid a,c-diamide adenosyltransferase [Abditibacteriota bacterium]
MSIVTRNGDGGQTRLIFGERVSKSHLQVEAYGAQDELNAFLGLARASCPDERTRATLEALQRNTFIIGAELASPVHERHKLKTRVSAAMTDDLDEIVADIETIPGLLGDWALPGATADGAAIDCARVIARRSERAAIRQLEDEDSLEQNADLLRYLNRVSDVLWLLGRRLEIERGANGALRP